MTTESEWDLLLAAGLTEDTARELLDSYEPERIREVVEYCCLRYAYGASGIVRALRDGWEIRTDVYDREKIARLLEV